MAAIEQAWSEDGVLVLMDLGAPSRTDMALEMLTPEQREKVHLSAAPLVEGAVAAWCRPGSDRPSRRRRPRQRQHRSQGGPSAQEQDPAEQDPLSRTHRH